jgi:hypothetical protein
VRKSIMSLEKGNRIAEKHRERKEKQQRKVGNDLQLQPQLTRVEGRELKLKR